MNLLLTWEWDKNTDDHDYLADFLQHLHDVCRYGHLKYQNVPLWKVTLVSWGLAFFEYCFQVPANRIGSHTFNAAQLKTIQEIITLAVFSFFSLWYLKEDIKWNYGVGFFFIVVAAFFIFKKW